MSIKKNDATVLAFEKKLVFSDGRFYGTTWENKKENNTPLKLVEKSVRGTISNRRKDAAQGDPSKLNAEVQNPNLQVVDACFLGENQDTIVLNFTLKVLGGIDKPSASNGPDFNESYPMVAKNYIQKTGFRELAKRYATNIANARFLWRNRVGAEKMEVVVHVNGNALTFNPRDFSLNDFDASTPDLEILSHHIAKALSGELPYLLIDVKTYALIGKAQEVYPSEELVLKKEKGGKSKVLYQVDEVAAMHSQKIGNAVRTIDTWYPLFSTGEGVGPIAIEPYGAVTNLGRAYRYPKEKHDFYTLFDKFALGGELNSEDDEHYVMAVLVRGGVFSQAKKSSGSTREE